MKIAIISGSPRKNSLTRRVALHLQKILSDRSEHEVDVIDMQHVELPAVESVITSVENAPMPYRDLAKRILEADGFILVTPEYNGSYSPAMKNLLDHFPKQQHKPFGIVTASPGGLGGIRAAMQLQQLVYGLFGVGSPHMLIVPFVDKKLSAEGELMDAGFAKTVDVFLSEYLWLAEKIVTEKIAA